ELADVHRRFRRLRPADVLHERRNGDGGEDTDDRDDNHELDEGEAGDVPLAHGISVIQFLGTISFENHGPRLSNLSTFQTESRLFTISKVVSGVVASSNFPSA